jgi:hypothetical protein
MEHLYLQRFLIMLNDPNNSALNDSINGLVEDVLNKTKIENLDTIIQQIATGVMRPVLDHMNGIVDYLNQVELLKRHSDEDQRNIVRQDSIKLTQETEKAVKELTDVLTENPIGDPNEKAKIENIIDAAVKQVRKEYHEVRKASNSTRIQTALEKSPKKFSASPFTERTTTDDALHQARETLAAMDIKLQQVLKILDLLEEEIEKMKKKSQNTSEWQRKRDEYMSFGEDLSKEFKIAFSKFQALELKNTELRGQRFEKRPSKKRLEMDSNDGEIAGTSSRFDVEDTFETHGDALSELSEHVAASSSKKQKKQGGRKKKRTRKKKTRKKKTRKKKTKRKKTRKKRRRKKKKRTRRKK